MPKSFLPSSAHGLRFCSLRDLGRCQPSGLQVSATRQEQKSSGLNRILRQFSTTDECPAGCANSPLDVSTNSRFQESWPENTSKPTHALRESTSFPIWSIPGSIVMESLCFDKLPDRKRLEINGPSF